MCFIYFYIFYYLITPIYIFANIKAVLIIHTDNYLIGMCSLKAQEFSKFVKQCKIKGEDFYVLQARMFDNILTNEIVQSKLELHSHLKTDNKKSNINYSNCDFFLKNKNTMIGCVYWISQEDSLVKVYRLRDFNVINLSYEMVLVELFFHFGIAFSLKGNKSVKDHFVCLELLKHCLVIAEGLELTKTLKNIKAIAF